MQSPPSLGQHVPYTPVPSPPCSAERGAPLQSAFDHASMVHTPSAQLANLTDTGDESSVSSVHSLVTVGNTPVLGLRLPVQSADS